MINELIEEIKLAEADATAKRKIATARYREIVENAEVASRARVAKATLEAKNMYDSIVAMGEKDAVAEYDKTVAIATKSAENIVSEADIDRAADKIAELFVRRFAGAKG